MAMPSFLLRPTVLLLSGVGISLCGRAQTPSDTSTVLSEARVEALHLSASQRSAVPLQHFDSTALMQLGVSTTADVVRHFAGVNLRDYGGAGGLKTVSVRGLGASHTVVSYDGIVVSNTQSGQIDIGRFPLSQLSDLSLRTADASALLCPVREQGNATLSLQSIELSRKTVGPEGNLRLQTGSFGQFNPTLWLTEHTSARHALSLMADFHYAKNEYPFRFENGVATHTEKRLNSRLRDTTVELNDKADLGSYGTLQSKFYFSNFNRQLPGPVIYYVQGNHERLHERHAFVQSRWNVGGQKWKAYLAGKAAWGESKYEDVGGQYPGGALRQNYRQREVYATGGASYRWKNWEGALATDYTYADLSSNLSVDNDVARHSLLASGSLRWQPANFNLTLRLLSATYWNQSAGAEGAQNFSHLSPSLSFGWTILSRPRAHTLLRAHYKDFFRAPTFTESYYYHLGSTDLKPEKTRQIGLGVSQQWQPADKWLLSFSVDGYWNRITDKISSIPYNLFVWRTVNLGNVRAEGLDISGRTEWSVRSKHRLILHANYSLQQTRDYTDPARATYKKQLAYVPLHSGAAALAWENPWVNVSVSLQASSMRWATNEHTFSTETAGYAEWSINFRRNLTLWHQSLSLSLDVQNIFHKQYCVIRRYPMPGRAWKASVAWNF